MISIPNFIVWAPAFQLRLSAYSKRFSLGFNRGYEFAIPKLFVLFTVRLAKPRPGYRKSALAGSYSRSLNQPKRASLTECVLTIDVHCARPYASRTVESALLPIAAPLLNTIPVACIPCGETQRKPLRLKLK